MRSTPSVDGAEPVRLKFLALRKDEAFRAEFRDMKVTEVPKFRQLMIGGISISMLAALTGLTLNATLGFPAAAVPALTPAFQFFYGLYGQGTMASYAAVKGRWRERIERGEDPREVGRAMASRGRETEGGTSAPREENPSPPRSQPAAAEPAARVRSGRSRSWLVHAAGASAVGLTTAGAVHWSGAGVLDAALIAFGGAAGYLAMRLAGRDRAHVAKPRHSLATGTVPATTLVAQHARRAAAARQPRPAAARSRVPAGLRKQRPRHRAASGGRASTPAVDRGSYAATSARRARRRTDRDTRGRSRRGGRELP